MTWSQIAEQVQHLVNAETAVVAISGCNRCEITPSD
jgi:hypothetical protein